LIESVSVVDVYTQLATGSLCDTNTQSSLKGAAKLSRGISAASGEGRARPRLYK